MTESHHTPAVSLDVLMENTEGEQGISWLSSDVNGEIIMGNGVRQIIVNEDSGSVGYLPVSSYFGVEDGGAYRVVSYRSLDNGAQDFVSEFLGLEEADGFFVLTDDYEIGDGGCVKIDQDLAAYEAKRIQNGFSVEPVIDGEVPDKINEFYEEMI